MKVCPKCQTKNQDSSHFCKKCGSKLLGPNLQEKRNKVLGEKKRKPYWVPVSLAILAVALAGIGYWIVSNRPGANPRIASQQKVADRVSYSGQTVQMTDIQAKVENGKISIPLGRVKEMKMVRFEYNGNGIRLPLLSYLSPSGRVVTAVSMCEPCRSTRFHIKNGTMVCNACFTEWDLETFKGIKGGCLNYPPDVIPSTVVNDQIQIDESIVRQWKPRV
jgi:ribosomal protein L40E